MNILINGNNSLQNTAFAKQIIEEKSSQQQRVYISTEPFLSSSTLDDLHFSGYMCINSPFNLKQSLALCHKNNSVIIDNLAGYIYHSLNHLNYDEVTLADTLANILLDFSSQVSHLAVIIGRHLYNKMEHSPIHESYLYVEKQLLTALSYTSDVICEVSSGSFVFHKNNI